MTSWKTLGAAALTAVLTIPSPLPAIAQGEGTIKIEIPSGSIPLSYLVLSKSGQPISVLSARIETTPTNRYAIFDVNSRFHVTGSCMAFGAPEPQFDPQQLLLHYGVAAQCDVAIPVKVKFKLFSGPTSAAPDWQDESAWAYGSGNAVAPGGKRCVDRSASHFWELQLFAEGQPTYTAPWVQFTPYPGIKLKYEACKDIQ